MTVATAPAAQKSRKRAAGPSHAAPRLSHLRPLQALALPLGFTLALLAFALLPFVHQNSRLLWSFLGAAGALVAWNAVFFMMSAAEGVGDTHRGQEMTFWQQACQEGRHNACRNLMLMESAHCRDGSGWACNELGIHASEAAVPSDKSTAVSFQRACSLGFTPGCENAKMAFASGELRRAEPPPTEYKILLRSAKGTPGGLTPFELYERACDRGWITGCEGLGFAYMTGQGTPRDPARAALELGKACDAGHANACSNVGLLYRQGDGVARDDARALGYLKKACDLGMSKACAWFESERQKLGITR